MNNSPFFSIPIATYNRVSDLEFAIQRILAQSFRNFEVIISDDCSTDSTKSMVHGFHDKRIRYFKNNKNLGAVKNIGKVLTYVRGKYVFLHGDDDFLLYDDVLEKTFAIINGKQCHLVRHNYLYQSFDKRNVFDYLRNKSVDKNIQMKNHSDSIKILEFMEKIDLYFITGVVFKNPIPVTIKIIETEFIPWFSQCYRSILDGGGYYVSDYKVIASWSRQKKHPVYYVKNGKLPWENLYEEIRKISGEQYYKTALEKQLAINVNFLMSIKYNSDNENVTKYAKRILYLSPRYKISIRFWMLLLGAIILPKFVLRFVRRLYIHKTSFQGRSKRHDVVVKRIRQLRGYNLI